MTRPSVHVERVVLAPEVVLACTTQALTTEAEEVMGLLIGDVVPVVADADANANAAVASSSSSPTTTQPQRVVVRAWRAIPQLRVDRRRDRVETSPEQIARAAEEAAAEARRSGRPGCKVVGWFHSHPHITVLPSHVDVATQSRYQRFADPAFVGVIASVFNDDSGVGGGGEQRVAVSAFQAVEASAAAAAQSSSSPAAVEEARARQALEGLDEATRRAIMEAAGGDLSVALAGTTLSTGAGGGGDGGAWVARLLPLGGGGGTTDDSNNISSSSSSSSSSARDDYVAVFRTLLEEERFAADKRARQRRRGGPGEEAARLLAEVAAGARRQRGVCALVSGALAPAVHLARLQRQSLPLRSAAERDALGRLKQRADDARANDAAAKADALARMIAAANPTPS